VRGRGGCDGRHGCLLLDFVALQHFVANLRVSVCRVNGGTMREKGKRIASRLGGGILLCGQGAASVKHVASYNNSTTSAVAFPAYRNEANLAPGSGCCHFCTLYYKRAQSARRKKRRCKRVLRGMGCGGRLLARRWGWRWRGEEWSACGGGGVQGKPAIGLFWDAFWLLCTAF
jgi:hypothetical protein